VAADAPLILASTLTESASRLWSVVEVVAGFLAILLIVFFVAGRATGRLQKPLAIVICLGPAVLLAMVGLIIPAINTIVLSTTDAQQTDQAFHIVNGQLVPYKKSFIGLKNYGFAFTDHDTLMTLFRTVLWIAIVPAVTVFIGLMLALLIDQMRRTSVAKTMIFLPQAISFVGAVVIFKLIYDYQSPGDPQTGLLEAVVIKLGWHNPPNWILSTPANNFFLMVIMVWIQVGFSMVVLGAALKAIPDDVLEAARMDGAAGVTLFRTVQVPMIRNTLIVVFTTATITTLKTFDIVFSYTGGNFNTDVLSVTMYRQLFVTQQTGKGAALAVILFVCVIPLIWYNVHQLRKDRAIR
jgi:alpha-glucoside transport system permease protein